MILKAQSLSSQGSNTKTSEGQKWRRGGGSEGPGGGSEGPEQQPNQT